MPIKKLYYKTNYPGYKGGWGNGYIGLPEYHTLYGINYCYDILYTPCRENGCVYPHANWTYSEAINPVTNKKDGYWWLGFDTNHPGDTIFSCPESYVKNLVDKLAEQYETIEMKIIELGL